MQDVSLRLIGTCPSRTAISDGKQFLDEVRHVSKWADDAGWEAILVYTDHRQADPWLVAQLIVQSTQALRPLIALQPMDSHPVVIARAIASLAYFYNRQVLLNMVAGGFSRDLESLCDSTPHDRRYVRVVEHASIVKGLLESRSPLSATGEFYCVNGLQLPYSVDDEVRPGFTVSGSSVAGLDAARKLSARAIHYLRPVREYAHDSFDPDIRHGTRVGVIVRESTEQAWAVARRRYPESPDGKILREFSTSVSDSVWTKELGKVVAAQDDGQPYWLGPYQSFQSASPFLVGNVNDVANEIARYIRIGIRTFLIELPEDADDYGRITETFNRAREIAEAFLSSGDSA